MTKMSLRAVLATTMMSWGSVALAQAAQTPPPPPATEEQPDPNDAAADAIINQAKPVDEAQAKLEMLSQQVSALQAQIEAMQTAQAKYAPSWKGAPLFEDKEAGWSFKPRGRIMLDAGWVSNPNDAILTRNLGFNHRVRRVRLGAEGTIPGGFGYKFEMDYANGVVGFGDVVLTYNRSGSPLTVTVGNHESLNGMEQISSSRYISFLERAQMHDAFINTRRLGLSLGLASKDNLLRFNAGLFAAHSIDSTLSDDGWIAAARVSYAPPVAGGTLHLGANFQHRNFSQNGATNATGSPSANQLGRYRARPFSQLTDVRFVDTGNFAAKGDDIIGLELAGIFNRFHFASEAQWNRVNAYQRGDIETGLNVFSGVQTVADGDPTFFSAYGEIGYYLTGETRGYKNGLWDRTKVLKPLSKGGRGALQLNGRVDYLDLDSRKLKYGYSNNFTTGASTPSINLTRGGKQIGYQASLIWLPEDYMRLYLTYSHAAITGGPNVGLVLPTSARPLDRRRYGVDVLATRLSIDF